MKNITPSNGKNSLPLYSKLMYAGGTGLTVKAIIIAVMEILSDTPPDSKDIIKAAPLVPLVSMSRTPKIEKNISNVTIVPTTKIASI